MPADDDEISLLDLLQVVADNLRLLVLGPLVAGLLALGYSFTIPPTFTATTKFMPPQQQQSGAAAMLAGLGALGGLAGAAGIKNPADQYVAFLKSRSVQDSLVDRFKLLDRYETKFREDARNLAPANEQVVGPLDFHRQFRLRGHSFSQRVGGGDGYLRGLLRAHRRPEQDRKPQPFLGWRNPDASQPAPTARLRLGENYDAFLDAVAGEFLHHVVGGSGLLEYPDGPADDAHRPQACEQVIGVKQVRRADEPVAPVRAGLDLVAQAAQFFDTCQDGRAGDAEALGKLDAGRGAFASSAQGGQETGVKAHARGRAEVRKKSEIRNPKRRLPERRGWQKNGG